MFDLDRFDKLATPVYDRLERHPYDYHIILGIFGYYFEVYEERRGETHPPISIFQIEQIMKKMPYIYDKDGNEMLNIEPTDNWNMIDQYFATEYKNCDYNINHFFSGRIREIKYFEACY